MTPEIAPAALKARLDAAAAGTAAPVVLLDVRTGLEHRRGHIPGARSTPLFGLRGAIERLEVPDGALVVAICLTAHRSIPAVHLLRRAGYAGAVQLAGGMRAWWAAGHPTERG